MNNPPKFLMFFSIMFVGSLSANASVPPDYKEPTRAEMKNLGFKYRLLKDEAGSSLDLHFPKSMQVGRFTLFPNSTNVIVKNSAGEVIARTKNWVAGNEFMSILTSYNHKVSDIAVSVTYACARAVDSECYGATTFSIPSVSKFFDANPDIVNLRPKCRNLTSAISDCTKYESNEYP